MTARSGIDPRILLENLEATHFLYLHDAAGVFTYLSPSVEKILGYTIEQFQTHYTRYLTDHPVNREVVRRTEEGLRGKKQPPYLVEILHADGTPRWLEVSETPVCDARGDVVGIQGIARDATTREVAALRLAESEKSLGESEARYRALFEGARDAIILADAADGLILEVNDEACRLLGRAAGELVGLDQTELHPPEERERYAAIFREHVRAGRAEPVEAEIQRPDGRRVPVEIRSRTIELGRGVRINQGIFADISERRRAETERARHLEREYGLRLEAEQAARDRELFLTMAAHELRTPLSILKIQLEGMEGVRDRAEGREEMFRKNSAITRRQVERMVHLVENLMNVTRLRQGWLDLRRTEFDLAAALRDLLERLEPAFRSAGCRVALEADETATGAWDRDRIEEVLENLLINAMKFGGGEIAITCRNAGEEVQIAIRDRGKGLPSEEPGKIFGIFERGGSGLYHGGLGLGLYIAREIARAHGGAITAENAPGGGAVFTLILPRGG